MGFERVKYYGYDRDTYQGCRDLIRSTNHKHIRITNTWFLIINVFYLAFSSLNLFGVNDTRVSYYLGFVAVSTAFEMFLLFAKDTAKRHSLFVIYFSVSLMMVYGISSTVAQPYMVATMFQVLVVLAALSYIDNMVRMTLVMLGYGVAFLVAAYQTKPMTIFYQDIYNTIVFLSLALSLHYTFQRARMQQFVTFQKDEQIQRELKIQSSFDHLTSLLNRGKFMELADKVVQQDGNEAYLCLLDLDGFKQINDGFGHQVGDDAIRTAAEVMLDALHIHTGDKWSFPERVLEEGGSFAGRLGGDEYIALIRGKSDKDAVEAEINQMLMLLNETRVNEELPGLKASVGVTKIMPEDRSIDGSYHRADEALYEAKRAGKNQLRFNNKYRRWRE